MDKNKIVAGGLITAVLACVIAIGAFIYLRGSSPKTVMPSQSSSSPQGGTIAVLAQGSASQPQANRPSQPAPARQVEATVSLPSDWVPTDESIQAPCGDPASWQVRSWQSATKTLTIFESAESVVCDAPFVADSLVLYAFKPTEPSLTINPENTFAICTKEQNQQCPRGDGKVSVLLASLDNSKNTVLQPTTKKSYLFLMQDTTLESDLSAQVQKLAKSLEAITLYQTSATPQE